MAIYNGIALHILEPNNRQLLNLLLDIIRFEPDMFYPDDEPMIAICRCGWSISHSDNEFGDLLASHILSHEEQLFLWRWTHE